MCTTIHHLTYAALSAAFDSISQSQLWLLLTRLRISDKIVSVIRALYSNSVSSARVSQSQSAWFTTESGVHQGCVLAPDGLLLGGRLVDCTDVLSSVDSAKTADVDVPIFFQLKLPTFDADEDVWTSVCQGQWASLEAGTSADVATA